MKQESLTKIQDKTSLELKLSTKLHITQLKFRKYHIPLNSILLPTKSFDKLLQLSQKKYHISEKNIRAYLYTFINYSQNYI